jgi:hypothetical protein
LVVDRAVVASLTNTSRHARKGDDVDFCGAGDAQRRRGSIDRRTSRVHVVDEDHASRRLCGCSRFARRGERATDVGAAGDPVQPCLPGNGTRTREEIFERQLPAFGERCR